MRREIERTARDVLSYKRLWLLAPAAFALIFLLYAVYNADFAEWYSLCIYRPISLFMHKLSSYLPISIGEILLIAFIIFCIVMLIRFIVRIITKRNKGAEILAFLTGLICIAAVIFTLFTALEGINYRRRSLAYTEELKTEGYTNEQLEQLCTYLADRTNAAYIEVKHSAETSVLSEDLKQTAKKAAEAYGLLAKKHETLSPGYLTVKPVFFSIFMSMAQITGIYSPFTAEANINTDVPEYTIPFTMCHELAHLQGYMQEEEANYLAFLACMESDSIDLRYSGFFSAWIEASNTLYKADPEAYKRIREELSDGVKADLKAVSVYWDRFEGMVADISTAVNDTYLKGNGQTQGVASYGTVTKLLLAYYFTDVNGEQPS